MGIILSALRFGRHRNQHNSARPSKPVHAQSLCASFPLQQPRHGSSIDCDDEQPLLASDCESDEGDKSMESTIIYGASPASSGMQAPATARVRSAPAQSVSAASDPTPQTPPSAHQSLIEASEEYTFADEAAYNAQHKADMDRVRWTFRSGKLKEVYQPVKKGKWWSQGVFKQKGLTDFQYSHLCRIMETTLGTLHKGSTACTRCQQEGLECWSYTKLGRDQFSKAPPSCARCIGWSAKCTLGHRKANGTGATSAFTPQKSGRGTAALTRPRKLLPSE